MMPPAGMAIAAITVMLWILWSDTLRHRRPTIPVYALRITAYLGTSAVLVFNMISYPNYRHGGNAAIMIFAALIGVAGALYFLRRLIQR
jgi:hypothetical protein